MMMIINFAFIIPYIILSHFAPLKNYLFAYPLKIIRHIMPIKIQKSCPIRKHRCVPEQFFVEFQKSSGHWLGFKKQTNNLDTDQKANITWTFGRRFGDGHIWWQYSCLKSTYTRKEKNFMDYIGFVVGYLVY